MKRIIQQPGESPLGTDVLRQSVCKSTIARANVFSTAGVHPFDELEWELRDISITDDSGGIIFDAEPKSIREGTASF